jgi:hypothetical protein
MAAIHSLHISTKRRKLVLRQSYSDFKYGKVRNNRHKQVVCRVYRGIWNRFILLKCIMI